MAAELAVESYETTRGGREFLLAKMTRKEKIQKLKKLEIFHPYSSSSELTHSSMRSSSILSLSFADTLIPSFFNGNLML